jgi:hypothetical protein
MGEPVAAKPTRSPTWQTAAAIGVGLVCLLAVTIAAWHAQPAARDPKLAHLPKNLPRAAPAPVPTAVISQAEALRRIALLEQQARLQTSLELMPQASWYDQQRADNQQLLDRLKAATNVSAEPNDQNPASGESL